MENLYSRQIGAIGKDAMAKIVNLKVVILGCDTVGVECVKSLALMGVKHFYLYDNTKVSQKYNGRIINYKKNSKNTLAELCKYFIDELTCCSAKITVLTKKGLVNNLIKSKSELYDCVVETRTNSNTFEYEDIVSKHKKPYIYGHNVGLLGYVFSNFGEWKVLDRDGENTISGYVSSNLETDQHMIISVDGLKTLPSNNSFILKALSGNEYVSQLLSKRIINNKALNTSELELTVKNDDKLSQFLNNEENIQFFEKKDSDVYTSSYFSKTSSQFDIPNNNYKYIDLTSSFNNDTKTNSVHENIIKYLAHKDKIKIPSINTETKFYPLGVIIGSILAHEVIKVSHKYIPLQEELVFDYTGLKSSNLYISKGNYWDVNAVLDRDLVRKIKKLKMFMIGCGALGCEISKNLIMMGFGECYSGRLNITDMDTIELSNLSRQFLFRPEDINKLKSDVVKSRLTGYKDYYRDSIASFDSEVGVNSENMFSRKWWEGNDIIINALDNVDARKYVDSICNKYDKPLFESGTLGTKANTQVILPYETATYSEIKDPVDNSIPMCTVRNFPNTNEHCVEWGLDLFNKVITEAIIDYNIFIKNPDKCIQSIKSLNNDTLISERYRNLINLIELKINPTKISVVNYVNSIFNYNYILPIREILTTFPKDMINSVGEAFWSGKKRLPKELTYEDISIEFMISIGKLLNIIFIDLDGKIIEESNKLSNNKLNSLHKKEINIDEKSDKVDIIVSEEERVALINQITLYSKEILDKKLELLKEAKYDKDDDLHNIIMTNIVNLRARCYTIEESDNLTIKLISGRIVPALSTTTSIVAGFVMIDILKYLSSNSKKWIIKPSECNINLATNQYNIYDSLKPKVTHNKMYSEEFAMPIETIPADFNTWSKLRIKGAKVYVNTILELVKYLEQEYKIPEPDMLSIGNLIIYSKGNNVNTDFKNIYSKLGKNITEILTIDICVNNAEFVPIITPPILYSYLN